MPGIGLTDYIKPKNDAFTGMVQASQVLGGGGDGTLPDACVAESNVTQHEAAIDHTAIANIGTTAHAQIDTHIADTTDPHGASVTLTTPIVGDFTNATHDHSNAAGGGTLAVSSHSHAMLDGSVHTDSVADAVTRGSLIYGNATPKWDELVIGAAATHLRSDGTDLAWTELAVVDDPTPTLGGDLAAGDNDILDVNNIRVNVSAAIHDAFGNTQLAWGFAVAAVNYITLFNSATGLPPSLVSTGSDTNIDLWLNPKGTGKLQTNSDFDVVGAITVGGTVDGRDVATDGTKLDGIEAGADVTDAANVDAAGAVMESDYGGYSILRTGLTAGAPSSVTIGESRLVGRITAGQITALTATQVRTLLNVADGADVTGSNAPQAHAASHQSAGGDAIKLDNFATPDDNTDLDFSTTLHGLVPKGTNVGDFLKDNGTWASVPGGATAVSAAAVIADNAIVRGDGGSRGVQDSGVLIDDSDAITGVASISLAKLAISGSNIQAVGAGTNIDLLPAGVTGAVRVSIQGAATANRDFLSLINTAWAASMTDTRTSILFRHAEDVSPSTEDSARITVGTETDWTTTVATQDAYMALCTALNGVVAEKVRINSAGVVGINTIAPGSLHTAAMLDIRNNTLTGIGIYSFTDTASHNSRVFGARARGTDGSASAVVDGDGLFTFQSLGYDGSTYKTAARITCSVDGGVSSGIVPGNIEFATTASTVPVPRLTIQSDGDILVDPDSKMMFRDSALFMYSSADGQLDLEADTEVEITAPTVDLTAATAVIVRNVHGINYAPGSDTDCDLVTVDVTGAPKFWWDESENALAITHRLILPEGVQTKYSTNNVADPPTDAELDTAFGDPTVVGSGFVGILDDNDLGTDCYICWTTGTAGEWFYVKGTKAV